MGAEGARAAKWPHKENLVEQLKEITAERSNRSSVHLKDTFIGSKGCTALKHALMHNDGLAELDLTGCNIVNAEELAEIVRTTRNLKRLKLEWNSLGLAQSGLAAFASALAASPSLNEIDLRSNRLGSSSMATLAHALRESRSLTCLDLRWNELGPSGGASVVTMLHGNRFLTDVRLTGNGIPPETLKQVEKLLERNRSQLLQRGTEPSPNLSRKVIDIKALEAMNAERVGILNRELLQLKEKMAALVEEKDDLARRKATSDQMVIDLETRVAEETKSRLSAEGAAAALRVEIETLEKENQVAADEARKKAEQRLAKETDLLHGAEESAKDADTRLASTLIEVESLRGLLARQKDDNKVAAARFRSEEEIAQHQIRRLEEALRDERKNGQDDLGRLRAKHKGEMESAEQEAGVMRKARDEALRECERQQSALRAFALEAAERVERAERKLREEKDAAVNALQRQLATLEAQKTAAQEQSEVLQKELKKASKALLSKTEECERALAKEKAERHSSESRRAETEAKVEAAFAEAAQTKIKWTSAEEQVRTLRGEVAELKAHIKSTAEQQLKQNAVDRRRHEEELADSRAAFEAAQRSIKELQAEIERRNAEAERRLSGAEVALSDWSRQQFAALRAATTGATHPTRTTNRP